MATDNEIKIQNVVVSCDTHSKFPLEVLATNLDDAEYEPESFPGLVYRITDPKSSALIFTTGKIICSGAKSFAMAKKAIKKALKRFEEVGVKVTGKVTSEIVNIVASANLKTKVELNQVVFNLDNCEYEPEQFPGVVHRLDDPQVVFLIFSSGKVICTGARSEADVEKGVNKLKRKLKKIGVL